MTNIIIIKESKEIGYLNAIIFETDMLWMRQKGKV